MCGASRQLLAASTKARRLHFLRNGVWQQETPNICEKQMWAISGAVWDNLGHFWTGFGDKLTQISDSGI